MTSLIENLTAVSSQCSAEARHSMSFDSKIRDKVNEIRRHSSTAPQACTEFHRHFRLSDDTSIDFFTISAVQKLTGSSFYRKLAKRTQSTARHRFPINDFFICQWFFYRAVRESACLLFILLKRNRNSLPLDGALTSFVLQWISSVNLPLCLQVKSIRNYILAFSAVLKRRTEKFGWQKNYVTDSVIFILFI